MTRTVLCALRATAEFAPPLPHLEEALAIRTQTAAAQLALPRPPSPTVAMWASARSLGGGLRADARRSGLGQARRVSRRSILDPARFRETRWRPRRPGDLRLARFAGRARARSRRDTRDFAGAARRYRTAIDVQTAVGGVRRPAAVRSTRAAASAFPGAAELLRRVARRMRRPLSMKRSLVFAVAVLAGMFVGAAWKVQAATTPAPAAVTAQADTSEGPGYWASVAEAASH